MAKVQYVAGRRFKKRDKNRNPTIIKAGEPVDPAKLFGVVDEKTKEQFARFIEDGRVVEVKSAADVDDDSDLEGDDGAGNPDDKGDGKSAKPGDKDAGQQKDGANKPDDSKPADNKGAAKN